MFMSISAVVDNLGLNFLLGEINSTRHSKASCYSDSFVGVRLTQLDLWAPFYHLICLFISLAHVSLMNENVNWSNCVVQYMQNDVAVLSEEESFTFLLFE